MWIKRSDYEELKMVSGKYSDVMQAIHNLEDVAITCFNFGMFMPSSVYDSYCDLVARLKKEISDLKEKTLDLQANLEYYKRKCGELMADERN